MVTSDKIASDLAWLTQRLGYGLTPDEQSQLEGIRPATLLARWVDPESHGLVIPPDPFEGLSEPIPLSLKDEELANQRQMISEQYLEAWLNELLTTADPLLEWMTFFWHDHFAVTKTAVGDPLTMANHISLLRQHARGNFGDLLRAVTVDPAMLIFLDGSLSVGEQPNENFGRELMEVYSIGVEHYTEADVAAVASALTGWEIPEGDTGAAVFSAWRHDDTPRTLLGVSGVHDVETSLDVILGHPALPGFIAGKLAKAILGNDFDVNQVPEFAEVFARHDLEISPLITVIAQAGLDKTNRSSLVRHPVSWLINALKTTGAQLSFDDQSHFLRTSNMLPGQPPHVGGFPAPKDYLSASCTAVRFTAAGKIADLTPRDSLVWAAATSGDWDALATLLGCSAGFSDALLFTLRELWVNVPIRKHGISCLTLALASPDLLMV